LSSGLRLLGLPFFTMSDVPAWPYVTKSTVCSPSLT